MGIFGRVVVYVSVCLDNLGLRAGPIPVTVLRVLGVPAPGGLEHPGDAGDSSHGRRWGVSDMRCRWNGWYQQKGVPGSPDLSPIQFVKVQIVGS